MTAVEITGELPPLREIVAIINYPEIPGLKPLTDVAKEVNFSRAALADACKRKALEHRMIKSRVFTTRAWAEEYISKRSTSRVRPVSTYKPEPPRKKKQPITIPEPKAGTSANNRDRSREEVQAQFEYERELVEKAKRLHLELAAKGLPVRVRRAVTPNGIEVLPMPRYYFAAGKNYVGFSVR